MICKALSCFSSSSASFVTLSIIAAVAYPMPVFSIFPFITPFTMLSFSETYNGCFFSENIPLNKLAIFSLFASLVYITQKSEKTFMI